MKRWPKILSYGGGLDSFAMLLTAIARGELPDVVVFMDTGHPLDPGEWPGTYRHIDEVVRPICAAHGIEFFKIDHTNYPVRGGTKGEARSLFAWWETRKSMPMAGPGRQCTTIAKVERFERWASDRWPDQDIEVWLGFEAGEEKRVKKDPNTGANRKVPKLKKGAKPRARRHNRFPLMEQGLCRCRCEALVRASGYPIPRKSACMFCLAGDTEVVTRDGVLPIRALVGRHKLLVPQIGKLGGLAHRGKFYEAEVRSFGVQQLWEIKLRRWKSTRVVHATAEHRWFVTSGPQWDDPRKYERTTQQLRVGDRLRILRACPPAKEQCMPVAVSQGFVFGDGSCGRTDERPAYVTFYGKKDRALLPYFNTKARKVMVRSELNGKTIAKKSAFHIYGLPRFWKQLPPINESRAFLLSWLAGYFAADGSVSKTGQAVLESADRDALKFARDAAAVCGVGYTKIQRRMRLGKGKRPAALYRFCLRLADLPDWFFVMDHHRQHSQAARRSKTDQPWIVEGVRALKRKEEVFCAIVPGAQAFGLSEDLMTGNCPFGSLGDWQTFARELPEQFARVVKMEADRPLTKPKEGVHDGLKLSIMGFRKGKGTPLPIFVEKTYRPKVHPCKICGAANRATKATGCGYLSDREAAAA
jgi:hypothetical protein